MPHTLSWSYHVRCGVQVTFEAPPGLKRNLQRTYAAWGPELLAAGTPLRAQLLFLLAWFHGIVQERRSFVPQVSSLSLPAAAQSAYLHQALVSPACSHSGTCSSSAASCLCRLFPDPSAASRLCNDRQNVLVAFARPQPCPYSGHLPLGPVQAL